MIIPNFNPQPWQDDWQIKTKSYSKNYCSFECLERLSKTHIIMATQIKAKFKCAFVQDNGYNKLVQLNAVYTHDTDENVSFAKATPNGSLTLTVDKETVAADYFQPTKEYYLLIEEAPAPVV